MKKTFIFYFTTIVPPEAGRWPKERVCLIFIFIGFCVKHVKYTGFTQNPTKLNTLRCKVSYARRSL